MDNYNLAADLLATFRASPDVIKALWLLVPPVFVLGLLHLLLWWRGGRQKPEAWVRQRRPMTRIWDVDVDQTLLPMGEAAGGRFADIQKCRALPNPAFGQSD